METPAGTSAGRRGFTYETAREKLLTLICENARVLREELADDKDLRGELHFDSFDLIGVVSAVEAEFGIEISNEEAKQLRTVGDVCDALWDKLAA